MTIAATSPAGSPKATPNPALSLTPVARWLLLCAAMVFIMAVIGAMTRLTESGLSIVRWNPIGGALPPLSEADWQVLFDQYRQTPQYLAVNSGMSLSDFKGIFWWEWVHRQWGRLIGLVFFLPFLWFAVTRRVQGRLLFKLLGLFMLGGLQGAVGWYMVASGLIDVPAVSHYRLALHLSLATLLMALLIYVGLGVADLRRHLRAPPGIRLHAKLGFIMVFVTLIWGAFVAGLDAGLIYNEFPKMGPGLFPEEGFKLSPVWKNFVENHAAVQFAHRWLALTTGVVVLLLGFEAWRSPNTSARARKLGLALMAMVCVQIALGITTLLTHVDLHVAVTHQAGALTLIALLTALNYELAGRQA